MQIWLLPRRASVATRKPHGWYQSNPTVAWPFHSLPCDDASVVLFEYRDVHAGLHRKWEVTKLIKSETTEVFDPVHWFIDIEICSHRC